MGKLALTLTVGLLLALIAGCSGSKSMNAGAGQVPEEVVLARASYDSSRPFDQLVKPHFFARSKEGELLEVQGAPDLILEWEGKLKIRLRQGESERYLDPLALESELVGEHPVHKVFRLRAMGVPVDATLSRRLQPAAFANGLFHSLGFEYLAGKETAGVVVEVFPDGTFLVIPYEVPVEWRSKERRIASPTHFHVNPRGLSVRDSSLAKEFEKEILRLPFDDQRYPPASLALKECGVYQESLQAEKYRETLASVGYQFTPAHLLEKTGAPPQSFGEGITRLLQEGAGKGIQYFGYESYWLAARLRDRQLPWIGPCDTAGSVRRYRPAGGSQDQFYLTLRRSLEPDKKQRYRIVSLAEDGSARFLYTAPGIMLLARPLPFDDRSWIMSTEGWRPPQEGSAPDPRWQSVYVMNLDRPDEYSVVDYPISGFPKPPKDGRLYGTSAQLSADGGFLFNILYGFKDEGGGLWVGDVSKEGFQGRPEGFARIVAWDHPLSWIILEDKTDGPAPFLSIFMTGKEVAEEFAMTANFLRIRNAGLDSAIERQERLTQMVGWNPVPFLLQRLPDRKFQIAAETHFNYESSLLPRAHGVYIFSVDPSRYE